MRKQEGGKKGSFSRQKSQDVLRLEDLRVGELREENDIRYCCNMGCSVWEAVAWDGSGERSLAMGLSCSSKARKGFQVGFDVIRCRELARELG